MKKTGFITRVNKGLRVWLFEAGTYVQQTDFTNREEGGMEFMSFKLIYMNRQESLFSGHVSFEDASSLNLESEEVRGLVLYAA
jgi:hypothetical protein